MTCDTLGLYARSAADLELLTSIFQLSDDEPVLSIPFSISSAKIAFVKTHVWPKAGPGLEKAWEKAKALLEGKGAKVEEVDLPEEFSKISKWHGDVLAGEGRTSFLGSELSLPLYILSKGWIGKVLMRGRLSPSKGQNAPHAPRTRREPHEAYEESTT
jgi:Asp-tRNA(Asn)/Glu-tRNA(Gln) amidotransferase A subunit family amidase